MAEALKITVLGVEVDAPDPKHITKIERKNNKTGEVAVADYLTVEGKAELMRRVLVIKGHEPGAYSLTTHWLTHLPPHLIGCTVTLSLPWGTFDGSAASNTDRNDVAAGSPVETAETSAFGRACGNAGIDIEAHIESVQGMAKAGYANTGAAAQPAAGGQAAASSGFVPVNLPPPNGPNGTYVCQQPGCTHEITGYGKYSAEQNVAYSVKDTGGIYCGRCKKQVVADRLRAQADQDPSAAPAALPF